ncbi:MAG: DsbA family protein [Xanthobacteraceae bacterium]
MATTSELAESTPRNRRQFMIAAAGAAVVLVAGGGSYYWWSGKEGLGSGSAVAQTGRTAPMGELMTPGPLGDEELGSADAPVTIIEYASMTCPHCAHFHETVFPELKKNYIDTGKVRFIFREFPLDPIAAGASALARCAGKDKYFPMIDTFFSQQREWAVQRPLEPMFAIARQAGFTRQSFDECLQNQRVLQAIEETRTRAAERFEVQSTPTFFINGKIFRGVMTAEELDKQLAPYLKG